MVNGIINSGQQIVTSGLSLNYDVPQLRSYPTTGTSITDLSGNSNTGTLVNGVAFNSSNGGSLVFDGTNDFLSCGAVSNITFERTNTFSFAFWTYPTSLSVNRFLLSKYNTSNRGLSFGISTAGALSFVLRNTATTNDFLINTLTGLIAINNWYNIVVTYNGSSSATGISFYINGVKTTSDITVRNGLTATTLNSENVQLGTRAVDNTFYSGRIASASIYNKVLTADEVLQDFNANRSRYGL
jgi:hypothetical protein